MLGSLLAQIDKSWLPLFAKHKSELTKIQGIITPQRIAPTYENVLRVFNYPISHYRAVIVGQDPYPTPGYAHGLAFSVAANTQPLPASLRNIFKELESDCGVKAASNGDLGRWADQGIFLLNQILTTRPTQSLAHEDFGWQDFTAATAKVVGKSGAIGIFWGSKAQHLAQYFDPTLSISSAHPSPLSAYRGFFGSKPFSKANEMLRAQGKSEISW